MPDNYTQVKENECDIDELIEIAENQKTNPLYFNNVCLTKERIDPWYKGFYPLNKRMDNLISATKNLQENGINLQKVFDYRINNQESGECYCLRDRVIGSSFFDMFESKDPSEIQSLANESQKIYETFITDWIEIYKNMHHLNFMPKNIFYFQHQHKIIFAKPVWRECIYFIHPIYFLLSIINYQNESIKSNEYTNAISQIVKNISDAIKKHTPEIDACCKYIQLESMKNRIAR